MTTFLDFSIKRVREQLRVGEIDQATADHLIARLRADAGESALPPAGTDPKRAAPVPYSDLFLAARALRAEGLSESEAQLAARHIPVDTPRFRELAERGRAVEQERADAAAEQAYFVTPEGAAELAREQQKQATERAERVQLARTRLEASQGDAAKALTDDEALRIAGLANDADQAMSKERNKTLPSSRFAAWNPDGHQTIIGDDSDNDPAANAAAAGGTE